MSETRRFVGTKSGRQNSIEFPSGDRRERKNSINLFYFSHKQTVNWPAIIRRWFFSFSEIFHLLLISNCCFEVVTGGKVVLGIRHSTRPQKHRRVATQKCFVINASCIKFVYNFFDEPRDRLECSREKHRLTHTFRRWCKALGMICEWKFHSVCDRNWKWLDL